MSRVIGLFPDDRQWGNNIEWVNFPERIAGWLTPRPVKGDTFRQRMKSGGIAVIMLRKVEYCDDPPDMFFADVEFVEYE